MKTYNVTEASKELGISTRAVQKRCLKHDVRKKSNKYLITQQHIFEWREELKRNEFKNELVRKQTNQNNEVRELVRTITDLKNENQTLKAELRKYEIAPNERIEVFTNEEYNILEQRLKEWHEQEQKLKHQEELFNVEKLSLKDMLKHYKNQWKYQRKQSEKLLKMHQTLIDTIDKQNKLAIQRQIIEAVEKDVVDENWQPKK